MGLWLHDPTLRPAHPCGGGGAPHPMIKVLTNYLKPDRGYGEATSMGSALRATFTKLNL